MNLPEGTNYDFLAPQRIVFGWGRRRELGGLVRTLGGRAFLVWGSRTLEGSSVAVEIAEFLRAAGVEAIPLATISREPLVEDVDVATRRVVDLRATSGDVLIPIGGGAAIDLAKAIAAMATNREGDSVRDYLEGVGRGLKVSETPLPIIAVPTTAGTGSEATKNAVISSQDPPFKKSLRSDQLIPRVALVDPELTVTCPATVTAYSGMDAITQCIESYLSRKAKPISSALAIEGLRLAVPAIAEAVEDGSSRPAREAMSQAALLSGMALANSGLGMAHGVAAALGIHGNVPHGLACAVMLPAALRANLEVATQRMAELEFAISGERLAADVGAGRFIARIEALCKRVAIPSHLGELGITREMHPRLVSASQGNSMDGNPRTLNDGELSQVLENLL